jgi:predicted kinase
MPFLYYPVGMVGTAPRDFVDEFVSTNGVLRLSPADVDLDSPQPKPDGVTDRERPAPQHRDSKIREILAQRAIASLSYGHSFFYDRFLNTISERSRAKEAAQLGGAAVVALTFVTPLGLIKSRLQAWSEIDDPLGREVLRMRNDPTTGTRRIFKAIVRPRAAEEIDHLVILDGSQPTDFLIDRINRTLHPEDLADSHTDQD